MGLLGNCLIFALIYYWSKLFPTLVVSYMFGITFQAFYMPFVLMGFGFLMGGNPIPDMIAMAVGHAYFLLKRSSLLPKAPNFL